MKKILLMIVPLMALIGCSYDDTDIQKRLDDLDGQLTELQALVKALNSDVTTLKELVAGKRFISDVQPGEDGGYVITLVTAAGETSTITISDGKDGTSSVIGVKQDSDGVYYWTLNGDFILDNGKKLPVSGVTPEFKIENSHWWVSYDNGATWTDCGQAQTDQNLFKSVATSEDGKLVYLTLADGTVLVRIGRSVTPFSWYRYIVLSENDLAEKGDAIVLHEKAHLRLRHSVDLLLTDLAGCLQWFNPAMWLLCRELRAIHEYEADEAVLDSGVDAKHYQLLLIRKAAGGRWYSVANSFNHSKLKNRITMMLRKRSSRWAVARVLFVLPLAGLALGAFARTAYVFPDDKGKKENVTILIRNAKIDPSDGKSGNPLILVDGREVKSIDSLSPDRIASISMLKDAASEAQYGEKGRDGVIIVTTKEGGADSQMQTFTYGGNSSSTAVVVRGAGTEPDSLAGRVRTMTYRIDGRRDSLGGDMVWKINGRDVDAGDLEELSGNVRSIRITKDAAVQGEDSAAAEGMMRIMTGQTM